MITVERYVMETKASIKTVTQRVRDYKAKKGKGKGSPEGVCWTCAGNHYETDCLVRKKGGSGAEGEHDHIHHGPPEKTEGWFNSGGGGV